MMTSRLLRAASIAAASMWIAAAGSAAEIVVLESTAPRFPAGQTLSESAAIELAAGEMVVIVTEDARLVRLEGPYSGPAVGAPPDPSAVRKALERLVNADEPRVGGVGAVRGDEDVRSAVDTRPEPWLVHAELGGEQCALRGRPIELWREDASRSASAQITDTATDRVAPVRWDEGAPRALWPEQSLVPMDEHIYLIRFEGVDRSTAVKVRLLAASVTQSSPAAAAWLAAKGCTAQARMVMR
jgi:hypothetical protein